MFDDFFCLFSSWAGFLYSLSNNTKTGYFVISEMADQPARSVDTNTTVGTSSNLSIKFGRCINTNMAMVTQQQQGKIIPYGYGSNNAFQYTYGYEYAQYDYPG